MLDDKRRAHRTLILPAPTQPRPPLDWRGHPHTQTKTTEVLVHLNVPAGVGTLMPWEHLNDSSVVLDILKRDAALRLKDELVPWLAPDDIIRSSVEGPDAPIFSKTFGLSGEPDVWVVRLLLRPMGLLVAEQPIMDSEFEGFDFVDWLETRQEEQETSGWTVATFDALPAHERFVLYATYLMDLERNPGYINLHPTRMFGTAVDVARERRPTNDVFVDIFDFIENLCHDEHCSD